MKKNTLRLLLVTLLLFYFNTSVTLAQWISTGPEGGPVWCMASCNDNLFVVTGSVVSKTNLYRSSDNGASWSLLTSPTLPTTHIYSITSLGNSLFISSDGIYRSDDLGVTWVKKYPQGAALLASGSTAIFAAIQTDGILRSEDNGETWILSSNGLTDLWFYSLAARGNMVFAGTGDNMEGVFRSMDNGVTWEQATNGMAYYDNGIWLSAYAPMITSLAFAGDDLYAGTGESQGIWKSADFGDNWEFTSMETMGYNNITAIAGNESAVIAGSLNGGGLLRSTDGGITWMEANSGVDNYGMVYSIMMYDNTAFAGTKDGVYASTDNGSSWTASFSGIKAHNTVVPAFALQGGYLYYGSEGGGVFRSPDEGNTWTAANNGLPIHEWNLNGIYAMPSAIFAWDRVSFDNGESWDMANNYSPGTAVYNYYGPRWLETSVGWYAFNNVTNPGLFRSVDQGSNWSLAVNGILDPVNTAYYWIVYENSTLYLATSVGIYYSADGGDNWSIGSFPDLNIHALNGASLLSTPDELVCGLCGGGGKRGIFRSGDGGNSWSQVSELLVHKLFDEGENLQASGADRYAGGTNLYASGTNLELVNNEWVEVPRIFNSQDGGLTWNSITESINNISMITAIAGDSKIFVASYLGPNYGIYCSADNGANWTDVSDGLEPATYVPGLQIINDKLFAGTAGNSVWKRNLSDFSAPAQPDTINGAMAPCTASEQQYSVPGISGVAYQWQVPQDWTITGGQGSETITVITGATGGLIVVIPSNGFGSGPAQYMLVTPATALEVTATIAADNTAICNGSTMNFTATAVNGGDQPVYNWLVNEVSVGNNAPSFSYTPENGDEIKLLLTSDIECALQNTVESNTVTALVNELPAVSWEVLHPDTLCINWSALLLTGGTPEGGVYTGTGVSAGSGITAGSGTSAGTGISAGTGVTAGTGTSAGTDVTAGSGTSEYFFNPGTAGYGNHTITYTYTDSNGCSALATHEIFVDWCTGIEEYADGISIYPNPVGDILHIKLGKNTMGGALSGGVSSFGDIRLYNSMGTEVYSGSFGNTESLISLSLTGLPAGMYILKVTTSKETIVRIIIKK